MKKRLLSLCLIMLLLLSGLQVSVSADTESMHQEYYSLVCGFFESLGIGVSISESTIDTTISRMDMLKDTIKVLYRGMELETPSGEMNVTDVSEEDAAYIDYAIKSGLISKDMKEFNPGAPADYSFSTNTILSLVSYIIDNTYNIDLRIDLKKNLRDTAYTDFKRGDAFVMLYNLLTSERTYLNLDETTILDHTYNIVETTAQVVGDDNSSFDGSTCGTGYVKVRLQGTNEVLILAYDKEVNEYFGRRVYLWYNRDGYIVYMHVFDNDDVVAEFNGLQYVGFDKDERKIYWEEYISSSRWETKTTEEYEIIPRETDIILNGVFVNNHSDIYDMLEKNDTYNIEKIQLLDANNSGRINLMKIEIYQTVFVESVDEANYIIHDSVFDTIFELDPTDDVEKMSVFDAEGNEIKFSDIEKDSVASVFEINGKEKEIRIVVSTEKSDGYLSEISEQNGQCIISMDDAEYVVSKSISSVNKVLSLGTNYILHLDHNGLVSGYTPGSLAGEQIGGIISVNKVGIFEPTVSIKLYTINGDIKEFETESEWRINDELVRFDDNRSNIIYQNDVTGSEENVMNLLKTGLIQYKVSQTGKISQIILPKMGARSGELGYTLGMNKPDYPLTKPEKSLLRYKFNTKTFIPDYLGTECMNFVAVDSNTKVIKIPSEKITSGRETFFEIGSISDYRNDDTAVAIGYTFDGADAAVADIMAVVSDSGTDPENSNYYVVSSVGEALNNQGDTGKMLECVNTNSGETVKVVTEKGYFPEYSTNDKTITGNQLDVGIGDIVRFGYNSFGDVSGIIMDYDCSTGTVIEKNPGSWYVSPRLVRAAVYSVSQGFFTYVNADSISDASSVINQLQIGSASNVITVDLTAREENVVKTEAATSLIGYIEDEINYSKLIYISSYGETRAVINYK